MISYTENPKVFTSTLSELTDKLERLQSTRSTTFLYTNNEPSEKEIKKTIASKKNKILMSKLNQDSK